jgi:hypothetical protein
MRFVYSATALVALAATREAWLPQSMGMNGVGVGLPHHNATVMPLGNMYKITLRDAIVLVA